MENRNYEEYDRLIEETKEQHAREGVLPEEPTTDSEVSEGKDTSTASPPPTTEEGEGKEVNYGPDDEKFKNQLNEDGTPKPTHEVIDPKKFGILENLQEARNAVHGGAVDLYNSVASLPKLVDPEFWQADNPEDPYKFN